MPRKCRYFVYITASKSRVLYVGVTGGLMSRVLRHKRGERGSFTQKYKVSRLVWFQTFEPVGYAIARETEIKRLAAREENCADCQKIIRRGRTWPRVGVSE